MNVKILPLVLAVFMIFPAIVPVNSSEHVVAAGRYVSFTKYLPDGNTERFSMFVPYSRSISDVCADMVRGDPAMRNFVDGTSVNLYFIMSAGSGFHFIFPPSVMKMSLWDINLSLFPSGIYCNYRGSGSETDIIPITSGNSTTISGDHKLLTLGFVGIVGWTGLFSTSETGFAGFTLFVWTF